MFFIKFMIQSGLLMGTEVSPPTSAIITFVLEFSDVLFAMYLVFIHYTLSKTDGHFAFSIKNSLFTVYFW